MISDTVKIRILVFQLIKTVEETNQILDKALFVILFPLFTHVFHVYNLFYINRSLLCDLTRDEVSDRRMNCYAIRKLEAVRTRTRLRKTREKEIGMKNQNFKLFILLFAVISIRFSKIYIFSHNTISHRVISLNRLVVNCISFTHFVICFFLVPLFSRRWSSSVDAISLVAAFCILRLDDEGQKRIEKKPSNKSFSFVQMIQHFIQSNCSIYVFVCLNERPSTIENFSIALK